MRSIVLSAIALFFATQAAAEEDSLVFIEQVGDANRTTVQQRTTNPASPNAAAVTIAGERNGLGLIASPVPGTAALDGGTIRQYGNGNQATVAIRGNDNKFHIDQQGEGNVAQQHIIGHQNEAAIVQGAGVHRVNGNTAFQQQRGDGNSARLVQQGSRNVGLQLQGMDGAQGMALAHSLFADIKDGALTTPLTELDGTPPLSSGFGNRATLLQTGDDNFGVQIQAGSNNSQHYEQGGGQVAVIGQFGSGNALPIEVRQQAGVNGTTPILITQTSAGTSSQGG
jgi:hypothetical protein